jgi:hypothetical protein
VAAPPDDTDPLALTARAEAEAAAIRGRAEVDARAVLAAAEGEADAVRGRAEVDAESMLAAARADRDTARRVLADARNRAAEILAAAGDLRRRTEQETLDRLLATRADLHDAIERLTEMAEPVLDLTDGGIDLVESSGGFDADVVALEHALAPAAEARRSVTGVEVGADPVDAFTRSAIGRAAESAAEPGRTQPFATEQPSRRREELRDDRNVL